MNSNWRSSWSVFVESWRLWRMHLKTVVQLWLIEIALQIAFFIIVLSTRTPAVTDFVIVAGLVVFYVYRLMASIALITMATDRKPRQLGEVFKRTVWMKLPAAAGLSVLLAIAVTMASFVFLIPGVFLAVVWSMSLAVLVVEHTTVRQALRGSIDLVRGWGWPVFSRMVFVFMLLTVLNVIAFAPGVGDLVASVLSFVLTPVLVFYYALTYQELSEVKRYKHLQSAQVPLLGKISIIAFACITAAVFAVVSSLAPYVDIVMNAAAERQPKAQDLQNYQLKINPDGSIETQPQIQE